MDKMREEFEAWAVNYNLARADLGNYSDRHVNNMWKSWKASRAALSENHSPDSEKMVAHEGWQLVPVEPTEAMISSVIDAGTFDEDDVAYFWDSMLAFAPTHEGGAS